MLLPRKIMGQTASACRVCRTAYAYLSASRLLLLHTDTASVDTAMHAILYLCSLDLQLCLIDDACSFLPASYTTVQGQHECA